jgi:hypothetical protein
LHLIGLVSDGRIHSSLAHLFAPGGAGRGRASPRVRRYGPETVRPSLDKGVRS